jgi:DNA helicase HerA-like ATPase
LEHQSHIGYIDGSVDATTQRFNVVLQDGALVQLDDLLVSEQDLSNGQTLRHYAIVIEGFGIIEGASLASDTQRIYGSKTMPGSRVRTVTAQILRTTPELWMPPLPGSEVWLARGEERRIALFQDRMEGQSLTVGLDHSDLPVAIDWTFLNGEKGAHVSVSGISGVATKTSYALFLLYMLTQTQPGRQLLGNHVAHTKAVIFNVKGGDLLHIDRPNSRFTGDERAQEMWRALGVADPRPFEGTRFFVPPSRASGEIAAGYVRGRNDGDYRVYGWTPFEFIRRGLLQFVFSESREQTQVPFVVDHIKAALVRHALPSAHTPGAVIMRDNPQHRARDFERAAESFAASQAVQAGPGDTEVKDLSELIDFLVRKIEDDQNNGTTTWVQRTAGNTHEAFLRRLMAMNRRLGHLIRCDVAPLSLDMNINVVDINSLHDDAQRFVVGAVLDQIWQEKQTTGRNPLRFIVLDELNKYAPREGRSPIKEILVDIAARGRSLGVILIGCQQNASGVEGAIVDNASIKVVGRLDAGHADEYRFLSAELRSRSTRFLPGTMVLQQPTVPAPIPIYFPFPPYATNPNEFAFEEREIAKAQSVAAEVVY